MKVGREGGKPEMADLLQRTQVKSGAGGYTDWLSKCAWLTEKQAQTITDSPTISLPPTIPRPQQLLGLGSN